jgi:hypothetical protein
MGQYKPMTKMKTTEPSVELKLKKGGRVKMAEGGKSDMAQDKAMIKKAMKQHDAQEHKGGKGTTLKLRSGGMSAPKAGPNVIGGLAGGIEATRPVMKKGTGKIEGPGYKNGGAAKFISNMSSGEKMPTVQGKTKGIKQEPAGYKNGGHAAMSCKAEGGYTTMKKMQKC